MRAGVLRMVIRSLPDLEALEPGSNGELRLVHRVPLYRFSNRVLWAIRRRLPRSLQGFTPQLEWGRLMESWVSRFIPECDVLHGLMGVSFASLNKAKRFGAATLIDVGMLHPEAYGRELREDHSRAGIKPGSSEMARLARGSEKQFERCDKIIVYSRAAAQSFGDFSYARKVVVVNPGVNHERFSANSSKPGSERFRVCYVGRIEVPKGIHHLVSVWKRLALPDAELTLIGQLMPEMMHLPAETAGTGIHFAGILNAEQIAGRLRESDLFVLPSMNEGLSIALLEAMSCGVPVVACQATGAEDCVTPGKEGLLIPGRNEDALADVLRWCHAHRDELRAMGRAARKRVESEFTAAQYADRVMALYKCL
jgi:glycosyltransferase involved in cell wall biosynthesis